MKSKSSTVQMKVAEFFFSFVYHFFFINSPHNYILAFCNFFSLLYRDIRSTVSSIVIIYDLFTSESPRLLLSITSTSLFFRSASHVRIMLCTHARWFLFPHINISVPRKGSFGFSRNRSFPRAYARETMQT